MEKHENKSEAAALRQKAQELLKNKPLKHDSQLSELENLKLIFELEVHQIELELQNEELRLTRAEAEAANDKYFGLYNLAPSGYFTLSRNGEIIELNFAGARMLGKNRSHLLNKHFHFFISKDTQDVFKLFLEKSFKNNTKESCEVKLTTSGGQTFFVQLSGIATESGTHCMITAIDITERKHAETQMREIAIQYQNLANAGSALIWTSGTDKLCNFFNDPWLKFTGRTLEQEMGNGWAEGVHPEDFDKCVETYVSAFEKHLPFEMEYRLRHSSGEYRWIVDLGTPNFNSTGKFVGYIGHCFDISERKQTEKALLESEEKFRSIFENMQDAYFEASLDGTILEISPSIEIITKGQFNRCDMIGIPFAGVYSSPEDRKIYYSKLFDQKSVTDYELSVQNKDGSLIPIAISAALSYDADGKPVKITGILRDITERKILDKKIKDLNTDLEQKIKERTLQLSETNEALKNEIKNRVQAEVALRESQEQLELVIKGSNDAPWDWNLVTDNIFYSTKWWQQLGYAPSEIPSYSSLWRNLTHSEDVEHVNEIFNNALASKNDSYEAEFRLLHKDGHYVSVLSRGYITRDTTEKPIRVTGTNMDLTERKRVEVEIMKAKTQAEKANRAKSEFLSRMSHELRTPMNSILGFAQLLDMQELNPKQKKSIGNILSSGKHLLNLIDEVLDISRIEAGRLVLLIEPVQLSGIISEMIDTFQPIADARQLKLEMENSPDNQFFVMSDRKRLTQVLINLLSNAVKYNRQGGAISIKTESMPQNDAGQVSVRISVTDTGFGIPPHDILKLFVPFERLGAEINQTEGTGLGLAIVKKIMDAMEGTVGVYSVLGKGSTFWIEMPTTENKVSWKNQQENNVKLTANLDIANKEIAFQNEEKVKRAAELVVLKKQYSRQAGATVPAKTLTILYIEDNIPSIQLVEEIIENHRPDIQLITSMFGKPAIKLATDNLPDLILLDLDLPDIKGLEVLANLLADDKTNSIPVVIVTADATHQQIEKLLTAGARDYLTKPIDISTFLQVVDKYTGINV